MFLVRFKMFGFDILGCTHVFDGRSYVDSFINIDMISCGLMGVILGSQRDNHGDIDGLPSGVMKHGGTLAKPGAKCAGENHEVSWN